MMLIGVVGHSDSIDLRDLCEELEGGSHSSKYIEREQEIEGFFSSPKPDVILIDLSPRIMAVESLSTIISQAHRDSFIPVLGIISNIDLHDFDFTLGFDDFVVRPFTADEILVRIDQLLWTRQKEIGQETIRLGDLLLDLNRYEVWVSGREVTLTFKEYEVLKLLASHPGRVFTREVLMNRVWGYDYFGGTRTVDVHIRRLRAKLEDPAHTFVDTVRNVGYRFNTDNI